MAKNTYRPRITDALMRELLECSGALLIEGAKWCGKTTSAEQQACGILRFNDPREQERLLQMAQMAPHLLLQGETPLLLDEWQLAPVLWDAVRFEVDRRSEFGQFLLTGSAVPVDKTKLHHSGAGRIAVMRMRPMSLFESGESTGDVSLAKLFAGEQAVGGRCEGGAEKLAFLIARGGWPGSLGQSERTALRQARQYYEAIVRADISRVDGVQRSEALTRAIMRSYARLVGTQAKKTKITEDLRARDAVGVSVDTVSSYLEALEKIFVIEEAENWSPSLRSRAVIRTTPTHYFTDPSIAAAAFGVGPQELLRDFPTMGFLYENLAIRDLRVYAEALDGKVYHFLNKNGLEVDALLRLHQGSYGAIEIKLGGDSESIEQGAATLAKFASSVDTKYSPAPSFLMVLTGFGEIAYRRNDGVFVVPIGTLTA